MNEPEKITDTPQADKHDETNEKPDQLIEEVTSIPPDREPGVPDMQVINGTPWLGLV